MGDTAGPREWDASRYDRLSDPQVRMALPVLDRLTLRGDETVLDAGCGSGRVTELLLERLPRGRVVGVDGSASMLAQAAQRLAPYGERVRLVQADLQQPLHPEQIGDAVDAVLSTATFHWIPDHDALFRSLASLMRSGAQLVVQCGGAGNIASVVEVLRTVGDGWSGPWNFATPEETHARLQASGFTDISCWLTPEPVQLEAGAAAETYLATVVLGAHLDRLPEPERGTFAREVVSLLPTAAGAPGPILDYVRLNVTARRG